jgi:RAD54-like protein 2
MPSVIEISSSDDDEESAAAATRPKVETDMNAADYSKTAAASDSDSDIQILSGDDQDLALDDDDEDDDPNDVGSHVDDSLNVADLEGRVLVNVGHPDNEDPIYLPPQLARVMKPHQIGGVRFLYDNVVESSERYRESQGFGCILGHSMGLGKTIQVCTFSDVFLTSTPGRHVLIIVPINTLQNWLSEFNHWLPEDPAATLLAKTGPVRPRDFGVYLLNDSVRNLPQRSRVIETWQREGGVLLMGYELYRQMAMRKQRKKRVAAKKKNGPVCIDIEEEDRDKDMLDDVYRALVDPGPDLIICDEGHRIKNALASTSKALKSIGTKRRVVLTGYPLQNNLMEYWCMVDFVRPNFLGTQSEFSNLFERPIANGQCVDSTPRDKRVMMHRAHVLTGLLKGFVQRYVSHNCNSRFVIYYI